MSLELFCVCWDVTGVAVGENADWKSNPTDYQITEQTVTSENTLNIRMAAGGGQAIAFMAL